MVDTNNSFYGKHHSAETKARLSEIAKNRKATPETCLILSECHKGDKNAFFGKHHSEETKLKISQSKQGQVARSGFKHKPESIEKMSLIKMGNTYSNGHTMPLESKQKLSKERMGKGWSIESRLKMSETYKKKWQDPVYSEHTILNSHIGMSQHPNKPETILGELLEELYPHEWQFVGNNKAFNFGRKTPDFIHKTKNMIIEHFGIYPHGDKARNFEEMEEGRIIHFDKYGYKALIIWDVELYNQWDIVIQRIKDFYNNV
jgi:hypothetical protein